METVHTGIIVTVNAQPRTVPDGTTVAGLIEDAGLAGSACAAEVNGILVPRARHADRLLRAGDRVELVTLVGGG